MILHGDCLEQSEQIESGSVDLILTDPPYGTVKDIQAEGFGMSGKTHWDDAINPTDIFNISNRILRKNGKLILFSQEPYTSQLITNAIPNVPFSYRMIWEKDHYANALLSKKAPVSYFEDILVFSKIYDTDLNHPVYDYADMIIEYINKPKKQIFEEMGHQGAFHFLLGKNSFQVHLCTEKTYNQMIELYGIDKMSGFVNYSILKQRENKFKEITKSVFNLWEGKKYKSNVLKYKKDYNGYHPTQKPIALLEDLIKTYSNENNLVVDLTCGSGSTAVAAINTKRKYIAIEKEEKYYNIAQERIKEANKPKLF